MDGREQGPGHGNSSRKTGPDASLILCRTSPPNRTDLGLAGQSRERGRLGFLKLREGQERCGTTLSFPRRAAVNATKGEWAAAQFRLFFEPRQRKTGRLSVQSAAAPPNEVFLVYVTFC
jgi:hypothetical protein